MSAVSPAIVIPAFQSLKEKGYGESKGISTLIIAASSIDDIACISIFSVLLGLIFSEGMSDIKSYVPNIQSNKTKTLHTSKN